MVYQPVVQSLSVRIGLIVGLVLGILLGKFVSSWVSIASVVVAFFYASWLTYVEHQDMKRTMDELRGRKNSV